MSGILHRVQVEVTKRQNLVHLAGCLVHLEVFDVLDDVRLVGAIIAVSIEQVQLQIVNLVDLELRLREIFLVNLLLSFLLLVNRRSLTLLVRKVRFLDFWLVIITDSLTNMCHTKLVSLLELLLSVVLRNELEEG